MTTHPTPPHIIIVGAGIIGLSHAVAALDAGYLVTVLDRDSRAVGASIRNFGHLGFGAHGGALAELADQARPRWIELARRAGIPLHHTGTLVLARDEVERAVLSEVCATERFVNARSVDAAAAAHLLGRPAIDPESAGLLVPGDLTVNPREAVGALAGWVHAHPNGEVRWGVSVHDVSTGTVATSQGPLSADHIIVTTGHRLGELFPEIAALHGLGECALQMLRIRTPHICGPGPAVLTGTSMLRYSAFAGPAAARLRVHLDQSRPDLREIDANVMLTRHTDGSLLIGDTHRVDSATPPFLDERWSRIILEEITAILGAGPPEVVERWQGIYAHSPTHDIVDARPLPGVSVLTLGTGIGMTLGPALGSRTIHALTESLPPTTHRGES
ncbi:TIGR03364 family FAD-dependent oxidoreductase [Mycetocola lacteus]|uniref:TIGR03364 family FAD-dependent oxidoreductase n=1 Tax=Mycetocola lacteus TaxID=76637 RepID=A0A3L7AJR3_9MICO|nr:TIGR03364 family FAD-dependent oxidoreductase [Mycetocola lacteus]RLP80766.1 TIGR03364 family FAD-dependent oxidoreductase [Mycetocola lacteus]RLP84551.1 TIGR03364 family FAD-dependent oxidoreductase [Mycetocola lacteus]